jgi:hypothetical protein
MQIPPFVASSLFFLHGNSVGDRPRVPPYSGYFPRDFDAWLVGLDCEVVIRDLPRDNCLCKLANHRQLVSEFLIELPPLRSEPKFGLLVGAQQGDVGGAERHGEAGIGAVAEHQNLADLAGA